MPFSVEAFKIDFNTWRPPEAFEPSRPRVCEEDSKALKSWAQTVLRLTIAR